MRPDVMVSSGINNEACQRQLLSEDGLTLAKALAMDMETAHWDVQQLRQRDGATLFLLTK